MTHSANDSPFRAANDFVPTESFDGTLATMPGTGVTPLQPRLAEFPPEAFAHYRIQRLLGIGGMGRVYLARDTQLDRDVAIKFIARPDASRRERFMREARTVASLKHRNIVEIHAYAELGDQPYIVTEYVEGCRLDKLTRPMPWERVLTLGLALSRGLAAAHEKGVLHRDIKPENVIVGPGDEPKLLDFGVAKPVSGRARSYGPDPEAMRGASPGAFEPGSPASPVSSVSPVYGSLTQEGTILGTPHYMAPEIWRREPATPSSDVYALGVLLYELCTGTTPFHYISTSQLGAALAEHRAPPLAAVQPSIHPEFAALVDRCLAREPNKRFASGTELLAALESCQRAACLSLPAAEQPYRGLLSFTAEERALFFGREAEIDDITERLCREPLLVIAGASGVGKSSLLRAGVLPRIAQRGLGDGRRWSATVFVPGAHPVAELGTALSRYLGVDASTLMAELASDIEAVSRRLLRRWEGGTGTVIAVDQLEELLTLSDRKQAKAICRALAALAETTPGVRVVATSRGDKLTDIASLPGIGARVEPALYILRPLSAGAIRRAIVEPAARLGYSFESEALIQRLVTPVINLQGGLPLLQVALSELWEARDRVQKLIPETALAALGGVEGALSRYADGVLQALLPESRDIARDVLLCLITADGSRARRTAAELGAGDAARRAVLETLVKHRLLVASEVDDSTVYEIAHEALIQGWGTLRHWLDVLWGKRQARERLHKAAADWLAEGRPAHLLWRGRKLAETKALSELAALEAEFVHESRAAERRRRLLRWSPLLAAFAIAGLIGSAIRYEERLDQNRLLSSAEPPIAWATQALARFTQAREDAFARFRSGDYPGGEEAWQRALSLAPTVDEAYASASQPLELAYRLDPGRDEIRHRLADVLYGRAALADMLGQAAMRDMLVGRLSVYDDPAGHASRLAAKRPLSLTTSPPGLPVTLYRYREAADGTREEVAFAKGQTPITWLVEPGSYVLDIAAWQGTAAVRYPVEVERSWDTPDAPLAVNIDVPAASAIPEGFVYVPAGWFYFGFGLDPSAEDVRQWYETLPLHQRRTDAYLIARHETTYEDWLLFLRDLPAEERALHMPRAAEELGEASVVMKEEGGRFSLSFQVLDQRYEVAEDQAFFYPHRTRRKTQRWLRFPVTAVSGESAMKYAAWLDNTGRAPGARLCREDEWERAARGADGRLFPHGDVLWPDDDNFDETYEAPDGKRQRVFGLDEVGMHVRSQSPFGLRNLVGNAREMAVSILGDSELVQRGGMFSHGKPTARIPNREPMLKHQKLPRVGFRVCARAPR